ncbi:MULTISPECIES: surface carbohydrate biosynthesis protein [Thalassobacillus]|uniref:surface carbohydrate biosynthesis protein n=1 Tax=Thalassobacillus TaxID=331971 RepID=UPI001593E698|nr:surface carbohydrate biosynthesis protein [Thalassobacillus devorans]
MGERWLYLPVEVKARELDAKLLLAYYAIKKGYHVILGEQRMVELAAAEFPEGIFYSKGYSRGYRKKVIKQAVTNGHEVVELDEEGLIFPDSDRYLNTRMQKEVLKMITKEFCWGHNQCEVIGNAYPSQKKKCHIVGNPRFDLLHPKFHNLYLQDADRIKEKYGAFILVNTRFPLYNGSQGKREDDSNPFLLYIKQLYISFIEMVKGLAVAFPHHQIIVRPHPAENTDPYEEAFSMLNNVNVIFEGNIIKWLMAAKAIVHNDCTSSIEAYLLEKPIVTYIPVTFKVMDMKLPNELGIKAVKINDVISIIESILNRSNSHEYFNQKHKDTANKLLSSYYLKDSGQFSYHSILKIMDGISLTPTKPIPRFNHSFNVKPNKKLEHLFPFLSKQEIQSFFNKIDEIENQDTVLSVTPIGENLYSIRSM